MANIALDNLGANYQGTYASQILKHNCEQELAY